MSKLFRIPTTLKLFVRDDQSTYVRDANGKDFDTPRYWAKRGGSTYEEIDLPNDPFNGATILGYDKRSEGGGAWRISYSPKDRVISKVDLYQDALEDILLNASISKGSIKCKLQWVIVTGGCKLYRVGSEPHAQAKAGSKRHTSKPIPIKDLKVGGMYRSARSEEMYGGKVWTEDGVRHMWIKFYGEQDPCQGFGSETMRKTHTFKELLYVLDLPDDWFDQRQAVVEKWYLEKLGNQYVSKGTVDYYERMLRWAPYSEGKLRDAKNHYKG